MAAGRPRSFDRDEALDHAVTVFWEHGYEATSISLLTQALGLRPASLYAAFGDKESLFLEAVARYTQTFGSFTADALTADGSARDAVKRLLHEAAASYTRANQPHGCLLISATTNYSPQSAKVAARLREMRSAGLNALRRRIAAGITDGELPADTDARALAIFFSAILKGMSAQARDGATTRDLQRIAETALLAWPVS